jgi:ethanolamine utilization protein EutA
MRDRVTLVGLDFGTTTSSAAIASAEIVCNSRTGRMELTRVQPVYQPEPVFTPFAGEMLDEARLSEYLVRWLAHVDYREVFGGGALVTGLAAGRSNASLVARQTRRFLQDAVIAVANDPCLESWLAFMGNCAELSRANPDRPIINLDIGGGTTNIALGRAGEVHRTGSYFVAARHVIVEPGCYRITGLSHQARQLLNQLQVDKDLGDELAEHEVLAIVDWYLGLLQAVVTGTVDRPSDSVVRLHQQTAFDLPADLTSAAVTLSGGVGQLVYQHMQGARWPSTTAYGDLGIDMAKRILETPFWRDRLSEFAPLALGRATVYGLLRYSTQVSGSTLYLRDPTLLPLGDLLIVGSLGPASSQDDIDRLLTLAGRTSGGACLRIEWPEQSPPVRALAARLGEALAKHAAFRDLPLVFLMQPNLGKIFGQYLTRWGTAAFKVIVIDEIEHHDVQFAQIGRLRDRVVPVSFFGMKRVGGMP